MNDLVEQLLFLARGDSNRINMLVVNVELSELVDEVITESRIIDDNHEFIVTCENVTVMADKGLIKQALRILIDNLAFISYKICMVIFYDFCYNVFVEVYFPWG